MPLAGGSLTCPDLGRRAVLRIACATVFCYPVFRVSCAIMSFFQVLSVFFLTSLSNPRDLVTDIYAGACSCMLEVRVE